MSTNDETGWLIETKTPDGQPYYWGGPALWTTDHLRAIRLHGRSTASASPRISTRMGSRSSSICGARRRYRWSSTKNDAEIPE